MLMNKGEMITCENEHIVAVAEEEILDSLHGESGRLNWVQPEPKTEDPCNCTICGERWARVELLTGRHQLHINHDWRWITQEKPDLIDAAIRTDKIASPSLLIHVSVKAGKSIS